VRGRAFLSYTVSQALAIRTSPGQSSSDRPLEIPLTAHVVLPVETASRGHGQRRLVLRVDQERCRRVLRVPRELLKEEFDRLPRVTVAPVFPGHEIADVHLGVAEPVVVGIVVVVDPANYLLIDDDAGCRARVVRTGPEPPVEDVVAGRYQYRRVVGPRRAERDGAFLARLL
jgi:hypothetical protein